MVTAQVLLSICATSTPGTMRRTSGMLVAPDRRISSWLITKTEAAVRASFCSFLETEVTGVFSNCSRLASANPDCPQAAAAVSAATKANLGYIQVRHFHNTHL